MTPNARLRLQSYDRYKTWESLLYRRDIQKQRTGPGIRTEPASYAR